MVAGSNPAPPTLKVYKIIMNNLVERTESELEKRIGLEVELGEKPEHEDAEVGVVKEVGSPVQPHRSRAYWVRYNDGSGVGKLTYERNLVAAIV